MHVTGRLLASVTASAQMCAENGFGQQAFDPSKSLSQTNSEGQERGFDRTHLKKCITTDNCFFKEMKTLCSLFSYTSITVFRKCEGTPSQVSLSCVALDEILAQ